MKVNSGYAFLADEVVISNAYAIQYAFEKDDIGCWKVVLLRKSLVFREAFDVVMGLGNEELIILVLDNKEINVSALVGISEFYYKDDSKAWDVLFKSKMFIQFIKQIGTEEFVRRFSSISNEGFWKNVEVVRPGSSFYRQWAGTRD